MIKHNHNYDSLLLTELEVIFDISTVYTILVNQNIIKIPTTNDKCSTFHALN